MTKYIQLILFFCLIRFTVFSQNNTTANKPGSEIFDRIARGVKEFQLDTSPAPDDKLTRKIIELRNLRGGFNINEAIDFKIEEDRQKAEIPKEEIERLATFFTLGSGKKWLDNATIWIYRRHFSYKEIKQLIRFYKSPAGQKMATDFPVIMMQSLKAAEMIKDLYSRQQTK